MQVLRLTSGNDIRKRVHLCQLEEYYVVLFTEFALCLAVGTINITRTNSSALLLYVHLTKYMAQPALVYEYVVAVIGTVP
ncbi:MAG: hypothetical protein NVSMB38_38560 [Ktedonobacteraceae bacterium]